MYWHGRRASDCRKSLAEFAPAGANKVLIIFSGDMCVGENTFRLANVRVVRQRRTASALRRAAAFSNESPTQWISLEGAAARCIARAAHLRRTTRTFASRDVFSPPYTPPEKMISLSLRGFFDKLIGPRQYLPGTDLFVFSSGCTSRRPAAGRGSAASRWGPGRPCCAADCDRTRRATRSYTA